LLIVITANYQLILAGQQSWWSKSLDNFGFKNCSPLEKSDIVGGFQVCLNKPPSADSPSTTTSLPQTTTKRRWFKRQAVEFPWPRPDSDAKPTPDPSGEWPLSDCS